VEEGSNPKIGLQKEISRKGKKDRTVLTQENGGMKKGQVEPGQKFRKERGKDKERKKKWTIYQGKRKI